MTYQTLNTESWKAGFTRINMRAKHVHVNPTTRLADRKQLALHADPMLLIEATGARSCDCTICTNNVYSPSRQCWQINETQTL